jgi:dTDP-4-dehydrorhamnose reductase
LAQAGWRLIGMPPALATVTQSSSNLPPILHWSDAGVASWYDFAVAIGELGLATGLLERAAPVRPLTSLEYPTPAQRPSYSLLDSSASRAALGLEPCHWRRTLTEVLERLKTLGAAQPQ